MKLILSLSLYLLAVLGLRAANPAYTDFRGTNGVLVITNPATTRIVIGPAITSIPTSGGAGTNNIFTTPLLENGSNSGSFGVSGALVVGDVVGSGVPAITIDQGILSWGPSSTLGNVGGINIVSGINSSFGNGDFDGTLIVRGAATNVSSLNVAGGHTNWSGFQTIGTANFRSNAIVAAGIGASSNAWIGGTYFQQIGTAFTNLNGTPATLTNLATVSVTGNTLTNTGDRLVGEWGIVLQIAKANTNRFQIFYGGSTVLDTGLQISSNCTVRAGCTIARKAGSNAQHVEAWLHWGPANVPFVMTNVNIEIAENNGIANTLGMKGASQAVGAHTNNYFVVEWKPGSR